MQIEEAIAIISAETYAREQCYDLQLTGPKTGLQLLLVNFLSKGTNKIKLFTIQSELHWWIQGGFGTCSPPRSKFFHFHVVFDKNTARQ